MGSLPEHAEWFRKLKQLLKNLRTRTLSSQKALMALAAVGQVAALVCTIYNCR